MINMTPAVPTIPDYRPVVGVFDAIKDTLFTRYRVEAQFDRWVMGGTPQRPEIIESWLRTRIMGGDEELRLMLLKTLQDVEIEVPSEASTEEIMEAAKKTAQQRNGNTFRRGPNGLVLGGYQVKALLRESTNILFAGKEKWGETRKGPKAYLAERVFVDELDIPIGRYIEDMSAQNGVPTQVWEPMREHSGTHLQIGQVNGPRGPRSTLTYVDYCERASIQFHVSSLEDCISHDQWAKILTLGQSLGLGALRSMGYGTFKVTGFEQA